MGLQRCYLYGCYEAFDSVPHLRLLVKLQYYGICNKTLDWIRALLAGRHQCVVVNGQRSEWSEVNSGIPQGSVLGPLLFLMLINDLPKTVQCSVKLFAGDKKVCVRSAIPGNRTVYRTTYHNYGIGQISGCLVCTQINAK